jgi:hypothetical protein
MADGYRPAAPPLPLRALAALTERAAPRNARTTLSPERSISSLSLRLWARRASMMRLLSFAVTT